MAATKRIGAFLLVLVFLFCVFAVPLAQPAHALAGVIVIGAVISVMALAGISLVAAGITSAQLQDWVGGKLDDWATARGSTVDQLISTSLIGTTINGMLMIGKTAADGINDFIDWLRNDMSLTDNDNQNIMGTPGNFNLSQYFNVTVGSNWVLDGNSYRSISYGGNGNSISFSSTYSTVEFDFTFQFLNNSSQTNGTAIIGVNNSANGHVNAQYTDLVNCFQGSDSQLYSSASNGQTLNSSGHVVLSSANVTGWSTRQYWGQVIIFNVSNLKCDGQTVPTEGGTYLDVNTGVITQPQVQNDEKIFLDVGALPGSTVTEVTSGVIDDVITDTLTVSGTVAEDEPEYVIEGATPVYGLEDVFPFCIPFDLYDFVGCLAADPVAPHFEWRLYVENLVDYTFVIDFAQFETVAQILRTMELLLFIVGLALVTRHLLRS